MQAADDVKFGRAFGDAFGRARPDFFERERVCAGRVRVAAKSAELAVRAADIGRIDVAVDVVIADVAVALFADMIGEPADRQQIVRFDRARRPSSAFRRSPARTFSAMGRSRASVIWSSEVIRQPGLFQGCDTNVAAPQKSRNNKLI